MEKMTHVTSLEETTILRTSFGRFPSTKLGRHVNYPLEHLENSRIILELNRSNGALVQRLRHMEERSVDRVSFHILRHLSKIGSLETHCLSLIDRLRTSSSVPESQYEWKFTGTNLGMSLRTRR